MIASAAVHPTISLLQTSSLTSLVQAELERLILCGELAPGAKLTEMALAARLGVSRGPLREAFRMLAEAGLVRTEKNRGVFVRAIAVHEAIEIFDLRAAIDELVGRWLAKSITPAALREIRGIVDSIEQALKAKDAPAYEQLSVKFHDRLVELVGNGKLTMIYRKLMKELRLFRHRERSDGGRLPASAAAERQIVRALAAGNADAAGKALFEHAVKTRERVLRSEQRHVAMPAVARSGPFERPTSAPRDR